MPKPESTNPQLPEQMQDCTILFKECEKGHGRLTVKNWLDDGCLQCKVEHLRLANEGLAAIAQVAISQWSRV